MGARVGIDLVAVADVAQALRDHGDRYLARVYSPREVAESTRGGRPDPALLALRFAAKEAAIKALRPAGHAPLPWTSIEYHRDDIRPHLVLTGAAEALADRIALSELAVSVTGGRRLVSAVVLAHVPFEAQG